MPECMDCGNGTTFRYEVEGEERRVFDEDGDFQTVHEATLETISGPTCDECDSTRVEIE